MNPQLLLELKHNKDAISNVQYASLYYKVKYCDNSNKLVKRLHKLIELSKSLSIDTSKLEELLKSLPIEGGGESIQIDNQLDFIYHSRRIQDVHENISDLSNFNKLLNIYKRVYGPDFNVDKLLVKKGDIMQIVHNQQLGSNEKAHEIEKFIYDTLKS